MVELSGVKATDAHDNLEFYFFFENLIASLSLGIPYFDLLTRKEVQTRVDYSTYYVGIKYR